MLGKLFNKSYIFNSLSRRHRIPVDLTILYLLKLNIFITLINYRNFATSTFVKGTSRRCDVIRAATELGLLAF